METQLEGKGKNDKELYELELYVNSLTERARWWWGTAPSEIRGESTKQYSRQTPVFLGGRCSRTSGWTPEARSRICVCRDRKSTRLNSSHHSISYAVFCL